MVELYTQAVRLMFLEAGFTGRINEEEGGGREEAECYDDNSRSLRVMVGCVCV